MNKRNFFKLVVGLGALVIALGLNFRNAANDYGIKPNSLSVSVLAVLRTETEAAKKYCKYTTFDGLRYGIQCPNNPGVYEKYDGNHHDCPTDISYTGTSCKSGFKGSYTNCMGQSIDQDTVKSYNCPK